MSLAPAGAATLAVGVGGKIRIGGPATVGAVDDTGCSGSLTGGAVEEGRTTLAGAGGGKSLTLLITVGGGADEDTILKQDIL